jgi:hypothetical protein
MDPRAVELIRTLKLEPHPEGGYFAQAFRSAALVTPSDSRGARRALTAIWFLLFEGSISRWHRLLSDEVWHHFEGSPVELLVAPSGGGAVTRLVLGPLSEASAPLRVVPSGWWQAARPLGPFSLVGCSVGPGFEYDDFTLLSSLPEADRPAFEPSTLLEEFLGNRPRT